MPKLVLMITNIACLVNWPIFLRKELLQFLLSELRLRKTLDLNAEILRLYINVFLLLLAEKAANVGAPNEDKYEEGNKAECRKEGD